MKLIAVTTLLLTILLLSISVHADIQYYGINVVLDDRGQASVKLTITFDRPYERFKLNVIGKVENFQAKSIAGPVDCAINVAGISTIDCLMNLTQEKRTIEINFDTYDFVKILDSKSYFDVDFSPSDYTNEVSTSVTLPAGTLPSNETIFPRDPRIDFIGQSIIVNWKLSNMTTDTPLRFQVLYEIVQPPPLFSIRLRYFIYLGIVATAVVAYIAIRYLRKSEKLVLSVLDEFERKVMDVILAHEGTVNQRRVVEETNLSKAKVSRVVKSLIGRGLIEVERLGRTNKLKLIKKKLKL